MKAITYKKYGPPEVLQLEEIDKPTPKDNELLIRIHAAEATKGDCEMRSFTFAVKWFWLPLRLVFGLFRPKRKVLGGYFSGTVELVGRSVSRFQPGDEVFGATRLTLGAYGEYLCLPEHYTIIPKPGNISFAQAAAVPLGGLNAIHFIRRAQIKAGEKVLVNGAGGSIGTFAVQIAKAMGAEVTAVDSTIKRETLLDMGADHFIDYTQEDFTCNDKTYDVIFSMVANASYSGSINRLKQNGRYIMANPRLTNMLMAPFTSRFSDKRAIFAFAGETIEELESLKTMIEENRIRPVVDKIYPMEQAVKAHRRVETEQRLGTVVIAIAEEVPDRGVRVSEADSDP